MSKTAAPTSKSDNKPATNGSAAHAAAVSAHGAREKNIELALSSITK